MNSNEVQRKGELLYCCGNCTEERGPARPDFSGVVKDRLYEQKTNIHIRSTNRILTYIFAVRTAWILVTYAFEQAISAEVG